METERSQKKFNCSSQYFCVITSLQSLSFLEWGVRKFCFVVKSFSHMHFGEMELQWSTFWRQTVKSPRFLFARPNGCFAIQRKKVIFRFFGICGVKNAIPKGYGKQVPINILVLCENTSLLRKTKSFQSLVSNFFGKNFDVR